MHEIGICKELVDAALRRSAGRPISRVRVRVGALHRVDQPSMDQAFEMLVEGTDLAGASFDMVIIPARASCRECGSTTESEEPLPACPRCGALDPTISGGDELMLEAIQLVPVAVAGPAA